MRWVTTKAHTFQGSIEAREEGGTPNILGILRAAIPLQIASDLGIHETHTISANYALRAIAAWQRCPALHLVGAARSAFHCNSRGPIVSFNVTVLKPDGSVHAGRNGHWSKELMLHPHFVATLLSDVYGIQVRARPLTACPGCSHLPLPAVLHDTFMKYCWQDADAFLNTTSGSRVVFKGV